MPSTAGRVLATKLECLGCFGYNVLADFIIVLHWRHNDHDGVWNHQHHHRLINRLFRRRSKKTSKLRVTGLCVGNSPGPVNSLHKGQVTRKMFPFDDVIMENDRRNLARCGCTSKFKSQVPWELENTPSNNFSINQADKFNFVMHTNAVVTPDISTQKYK